MGKPDAWTWVSAPFWFTSWPFRNIIELSRIEIIAFNLGLTLQSDHVSAHDARASALETRFTAQHAQSSR